MSISERFELISGKRFLGAPAHEVAPYLEDSNPDVVKLAIDTLAKMGDAGGSFEAKVASKLGAPQAVVRTAAILYFAEFSLEAVLHGKQLCAMFADNDRSVRRAADKLSIESLPLVSEGA